ncbi:MAG: aquaporin [Phycisphaerales bacterium]
MTTSALTETAHGADAPASGVDPARAQTGARHVALWLIDGALLGCFMLSVAVFVGLIESPASPLRAHLPWPLVRNALIGLAMGLTLIALVYSPWGGRSGAHMNPAFTIAFWRLGKIGSTDAAGYIAAQLLLGLAGTYLGALLMGAWFTEPPVTYAPTLPGRWGVWVAFSAEFAMTFTLMGAVLVCSNTKRLAPYTGLAAACLLATFITFESPISGMSLNPARTLASAIPAGRFDALWIYIAGPIAGMVLAAEVFRNLRALPRVHCCKLNHARHEPCVFCGCDGPIDFDAHRDDPR